MDRKVLVHDADRDGVAVQFVVVHAVARLEVGAHVGCVQAGVLVPVGKVFRRQEFGEEGLAGQGVEHRALLAVADGLEGICDLLAEIDGDLSQRLFLLFRGKVPGEEDVRIFLDGVLRSFGEVLHVEVREGLFDEGLVDAVCGALEVFAVILEQLSAFQGLHVFHVLLGLPDGDEAEREGLGDGEELLHSVEGMGVIHFLFMVVFISVSIYIFCR